MEFPHSGVAEDSLAKQFYVAKLNLFYCLFVINKPVDAAY